jgi:predicted hotdog family 3-hydroxylacyl-ACP dehydratase
VYSNILLNWFPQLALPEGILLGARTYVYTSGRSLFLNECLLAQQYMFLRKAPSTQSYVFQIYSTDQRVLAHVSWRPP